MGVAGYRFRAEIRGSGRQLLVTTLVFGLAGGLALASLAGARRGVSAFPRLLEATDAGDLLVNPDNGVFSALDPDELDTIPGVEASTYVGGALLVLAGQDGQPDLGFEAQALAYSDGVERDRPIIRAGRAPDPRAVDEVLMSASLADRLEVEPGDTLPMFVSGLEAIEACESPEGDEEACFEAFEPIEMTVVGLGVAPDEVADPTVEDSRIALTAAFLDAHPESILYWGATLHLDGSVTPTEMSARVSALVPDEAVAFESTEGQLGRFQASVRPQAIALALFGALVGAAALLLAGLALVRQAVALAEDRRPIAVMGARPRTLIAVGAGHGLACAVVGGAVAVAVAIALSPLAPAGLAHDAEPNRGVDVDLIVLAGGVAVSLLTLVAAAAGATWRSLRREGRPAPGRPARLAAMIASIGGRPASVLGARFAFDPGTGDRAVPVRSTVATVALAVAGTLAAVTFGASLGHLLSTPAEFGSNWDAVLDVGLDEPALAEEGDPRAQEAAAATAAEVAADDLIAQPEVIGVSVLAFASVEIEDKAVAALGIDPRSGTAHPTLVEGHPPSRPDEVVLGSRILERTGASVGDRVTVSGTELDVVGRAVFPGYSEYAGQDPTDLGEGAWLTPEGLTPLGAVFPGRHLLVDLAPGVDAEAFFEDHRPEEVLEDGVLLDRFRPSTVANLERVRSTPVAVAVALAVLGALAAGHALALSVRRRRPVLAILRALGFDRRQVAATVAWQATWTGLAALAVGIPLGVIAGRLAWSATIERLGGVSPSIVPVAATLAVVGATILLVNAVAALPALRAARTPTDAALRVE